MNNSQAHFYHICTNDRFEEAIDYMKMLVADDPDHLRAQSQLATCYMQTNRTELAKKTFDLALQLDPMDPVTLQNYGTWVHIT